VPKNLQTNALTDVEYSEFDYDADGEGKVSTDTKKNTRGGKK